MGDILQQLVAFIRKMNDLGWSPATSTNYSFRNPEEPNVIWVSKSGIDKSSFTENDFMKVDLFGKPLPEYSAIKSSAETLIHCAIYSVFPDTNCILHTHSRASTVLSSLVDNSISFEGYEVLKGYSWIKTHETQVNCSVFDNTQNMEQLFIDLKGQLSMSEIPAFVLRKHGTYAWGNSFAEAKRHLETTEFLLECELTIKTIK